MKILSCPLYADSKYVVFVLNVPPTAKAIWRRGHGLKSHPGEAGDRTSDPWFTRQVAYLLHHSGLTNTLIQRNSSCQSLAKGSRGAVAIIGCPSYVARLQWSSLCIFAILGKTDAYMTLCNNHVLCVASSSGHYQVCSSYVPTPRGKS